MDSVPSQVRLQGRNGGGVSGEKSPGATHGDGVCAEGPFRAMCRALAVREMIPAKPCNAMGMIPR